MKRLLFLFVLGTSFSAFAQQKVITNKPGKDYTATEDKKISLKLPAGYVPIPGMNGFMEGTTGTETITIGDVPQSYASVQPAFTTQALKDGGMEELGREEFTINNMPALLIKVKQGTGLGNIIKYILITGNDAITFVINGQYPDTKTDKDKVVRAAVLSVVYNG